MTIPAAVDRAATLPGRQTASVVMVVSMMQRIGPMVSPLLIGVIADDVSLRAGLITVPLVAAVLGFLARSLADPPTRR